LATLPPNPASGEVYLTDMAEALRRDGLRVLPFRAEDPTEILGINNRVELAEVDQILRLRKCRELMLAGVTIEKPETVVIDRQVQVGLDTVIEPFTRLLGRTKIGEDCRVHSFSVLEDATLEDKAAVGPFARLRPGAYLETGAHMGNFVELKKTRLGAGSKAMHLTYLGDSTIGSKVNIGAGTITCNYDGKGKYPTKIGSGAFVGSHSTLVAPVEVGEGSYIAAGSVVTEAVPPDALAIARSHQTNKEGWASKRRAKK